MDAEFKKLTNKHKFIGNEVIPIKHTDVSKISRWTYSLSLKLDGERKLLFISNNGQSYLIDRKFNFEQTKSFKGVPPKTIFDGEFYDGKFYIFDTLFFNGKDTRKMSLKFRIKYIKETFKGNDPFIKIKEHYFPINYKEKIQELINQKKFLSDGLIFTPTGDYYHYPLKWKKTITIDLTFGVIKQKLKTQVWELFAKNKTPFRISPTLEVPNETAKLFLNTSPVEFEVNRYGKLSPIKQRFDKVDGNYINVAINNFLLARNPVNINNILDEETSFQTLRSFHNFIKRTLLEVYSKKESTLLDLACGKGGDILKWKLLGLKVDGYDINKRSIKIANKRKKGSDNIKFHILDLSKELIKCTEQYDTATCFFALHYFFQSEQTLNNFFTNVSNCLKPGGYFIGTILDGSKIKESVITKDWRIEKLNKKSEGYYNNAIKVFIRNTVLNKPTIEYIVNIPFLTSVAKNYNLRLVKIIPFSLFKKLQSKIGNKVIELNESDKKLSCLNSAFVFVKN